MGTCRGAVGTVRLVRWYGTVQCGGAVHHRTAPPHRTVPYYRTMRTVPSVVPGCTFAKGFNRALLLNTDKY